MPMLKDNPEPMKLEVGDAVAGFPDEVQNAPIGPTIGVAAIALNMALKYYDINTVQEGTLYQQYKLEGRNMPGLHLDMVFEAAMRIEEHLIGGNKRVAMLMVVACLDEDEAEDASITEEPEAETPTSSDAQ